jgi:hypothetical protein
MKATIKYPAAGQEAYWQKTDDGKTVCRITVTAEDGKDYKLRILEGSPEWTKVKGDALNIELRTNKSTGDAYAVLEGTPQAGPRFSGGGGNFAPRKTYTVEDVGKTAVVAARLAAHTYCTLRAALEEKGQQDATAEDVRTMTNTIIIELMKRLP